MLCGDFLACAVGWLSWERCALLRCTQQALQQSEATSGTSEVATAHRSAQGLLDTIP